MDTLLTSAVTGIVGGSLYLAVGSLLLARNPPGRSPEVDPLWFFALFWISIGTYGLLNAVWTASFLGGGAPPLGVAVAILQLKILTGVAGFYGLVAYLLSIYLGDRRVPQWLAIGYAGIYLVVDLFYQWRVPVGQHAATWGATLDYANPQGPLWGVVVVLLFVPPLLSTLAYAWLYTIVNHRGQKVRVAVISVSLAVLFMGLLLGWLSSAIPAWGLIEKLLAVAANLAVLAVVWPLPSLGRRLDLEGLGSSG